MTRLARHALVLFAAQALTACPPEMSGTGEVSVQRLPVPIGGQLADEPVWKLAVADDGTVLSSAGWTLRHFRLTLGEAAWQPFSVPDGLTLVRGTGGGVVYFQSTTGWATYFEGRFRQTTGPACKDVVGGELVDKPLELLDFGPNDVAWFRCGSERFLARYDPHQDRWTTAHARVELGSETGVAVTNDGRLLLGGGVQRSALLELTDAGVVERLPGAPCQGAACLGCARPGIAGRFGALWLPDAPQTLLASERGAVTALPNGSLEPTDVSPAVQDDQVVVIGSVVLDPERRLWASLRHGTNDDDHDLGRVYRLQADRRAWVKVFESDTHLRPELVSHPKLAGVILWDGNPRESPRGDPPRVGLFWLRAAAGAPGTWPTVQGAPGTPVQPTTGWWASRLTSGRADGGALEQLLRVDALAVDGGVLVLGAGDTTEPITALTFTAEGVRTGGWARTRPPLFSAGLVKSGPPRVRGEELWVPWSEVNVLNQNQGTVTFDRFAADGAFRGSTRYRADFNIVGDVSVNVAADGALWWTSGRAVGHADVDGGTFAVRVSSPSRDAVIPRDVAVLPSGDAVVTATGSVLGLVTVFRVSAAGQVVWSRDLWVGEGAMTNTNANVASNLAVNDAGEVLLCVGTRHSETPVGALVTLSPDGQTATARAFRTWLTHTTECGVQGLRGVRLSRAGAGWVCHFDRRARPEDTLPFPGVRAHFPSAGAVTAVGTRGVGGAAFGDGSWVELAGQKSSFTLVHGARAEACEEPRDVVELGNLTVVLRSMQLTAGAGTFSPLDAGVPLDAPLAVDAGAVFCE